MSAVHPLDHRSHRSATGAARCRQCDARLDSSRGDFINRRICAECRKHPTYRESLAAMKLATGQIERPPQGLRGGQYARAFTVAERSLVRKVHGFMPAQQLLDLLNERLYADLGQHAIAYTMDQLQAELACQLAATPTSDWAGTRKVLANARHSGLLDLITTEIMEDFAVVFQLTPQQSTRLKDILASARANGTTSP